MTRILTLVSLALFCTVSRALPQAEFTEHILSPSYQGANTLDVADMDGDKDPDIVSTSLGGDEITWWENEDSLQFEEHYVDTQDSPSRIMAADLNSDGCMDIVCAFDHSNQIRWWKNDGTMQFFRLVVATNYPEARGVDVADMDGDGDMDVVSCGQWRVTWFENDGDEHFTAHDLADNFPGAAMVAARDFDRDGDLDVFCVAYWWNQIAWWINDGEQNFTRQNLGPTLDDPHWLEVADLDGDLDLDVIVTGRADNRMIWFENTLDSFVEHEITDAVQGPQGIAAGDYDIDGDMDFVVAGRTDCKLWLFENDEGMFSGSVIMNGLTLTANVAAGNFDLDADLDFASTTCGFNRISVWENSAGDTIGPWSLINIHLMPFNPPVILPPVGGPVFFTVTISNGTPGPVSGLVWAHVQTPTGNIVQFQQTCSLTVQGNSSLVYPYMEADVPGYAPAGEYIFRASIGSVYPYPMDSDEFTFTKLEGRARGSGMTGWDLAGWGVVDSHSAGNMAEPAAFEMTAFPNPFNQAAMIRLHLPEATDLELRLVNIQGRTVRTLASGWTSAGMKEYNLNAEDLASGVYLLQTQIPNGELYTRKLVLLK